MDSRRLGTWHETTVQSVAALPQRTDSPLLPTSKRIVPRPENPNGDLQESRKRQRTIQSGAKELPRLEASSITLMREMPSGLSEYSQRKLLQATPDFTIDPLLSLRHSFYGLPQELWTNFQTAGIKSIYPWQKQCLLGPGILSGRKNLVYSAPTGGGKSLVADVIIIKRVLTERSAKAIVVLPFVALVQEKVNWLRSVLVNVSKRRPSDDDAPAWRTRAETGSIRVVGCFGGSKVRVSWADFDIAVCTIEKANALLNTAIAECSVSDLKVMILDELHMVDDGHRGYLLELLAAKLLCLDSPVQIIGMSATLPNIKLLATWLEGHSYETRYRPIPIIEHLVCDGNVYFAEETQGLLGTGAEPAGQAPPTGTEPGRARVIQASEHRELRDSVVNAVVALACQTVQCGWGVLVFCGSRATCEADALLISRAMPALERINADTLERRADVMSDLRSLSGGIDPTLERTIPYDVVFHHAGLTTEEREILAGAFNAGIVKICVATCSLAAGINLPVRRVILHNAKMGKDLMGPSMLRQMRGRAGRKGKDEIGETYLCCNKSDLEAVVELMHSDLPETTSCLVSDKRRMQRALLEAISIRLANSPESLDDYVKKTLLYHSESEETAASHVRSGLSDLLAMSLLTKDDFSGFQATRLGHAIVASGLDPEDGVFIHEELSRALQAFVMDGDMHVLYNFRPVNGAVASIDWRVFWDEMENFDDSSHRTLALLGLKRTVINKMMHGGSFGDTTAGTSNEAWRYHRFYLALQLRDLCNEMPVHRVARKYSVSRDSVQNLSQTCQGFAAGMVKFCEKMDWGAMAAALDHFSDRLRAGARTDLLALAKIPFVKSRTARVFWENNLKSVAAIANANPRDLVPILMQAQPSKLRLETKDDELYQEKLLLKAKIITESANRIWQNEIRQELFDTEQ